MRRVCLFSFYDEQGVVDDYVIFFLKELGSLSRISYSFPTAP